MSGILGLWNLDGQPIDRSLLANMSRTLAHRGPDGERCEVLTSIGMACQNFNVTPESVGELQPLLDDSKTVIVFDGRVDNREEIFQNLKGKLTALDNYSDSALVLAAYHVFGEKLPEYLNGDFAFAIYDPDRERLILARDAIGVRPLYYYYGNNVFIFASEIKAILQHPSVPNSPDEESLASWLIGGTSAYGGVQGKTFFDRVYSIPPAHKAIITPNAIVVEQYWDFHPGERIRFASSRDYQAAFLHYFSSAVKRRIRSAFPVAIAVSGGLDSSAIFCEAERLRQNNQNHLPQILGFSWTYEDGSPADEKKYLTKIEEDFGTEIQKVPMMASGFSGVCNMAVWHADAPFLDANQTDIHLFNDKVSQTGARTLVTGHWGDQFLFNMSYLIDLFHKFEWGKVFQHLDEFPRWMTDASPDNFSRKVFFRSLLRYHMPEALGPVLRKIRGRFLKSTDNWSWYTNKLQNCIRNDNVNYLPANRRGSAHFKALYDQARSNYYVLCMEQNNKIGSISGLEMAYPFLDRDLIRFLMSIPGEILAENGQIKALLRQSMQKQLPSEIINRRWKADFTDQLNMGMEKNLSQLDNLFQQGANSVHHGYVKDDLLTTGFPKLKEQIKDTNYAILSWKLEKLFAFEIWLRTFF